MRRSLPLPTFPHLVRYPSSRRVALRACAIAGSVAVVLMLALVNLRDYPATWFDEGQYLHVPKALLQHGVYADWSSEGARYFGPTTAAGPTVLLPIAATYAMFGIGLIQARLVMVVYLLAMLGAFYLLGSRLYDRRVALFATIIVLVSRGAPTLLYGRQVQGEVPALLWVIAGVYVWCDPQPRSIKRALLVGACWGIGMITKNQVAVALTPALVLLVVLDWRDRSDHGWLPRLLPLVSAVVLYVGWLVILFGPLAPGSAAANIAATRQATSGALIVLTPQAIGRALRFVVSPTLYGGLLLPALLYNLWRVRHRSTATTRGQAVLITVVGVWILWFVCSLGWPRYAYIGVTLGALPVARMLADGVAWVRHKQPALAAIGVAVAVAIVIVPLAQTVLEIAQPDRSVQSFAQYLRGSISQNDLIETWEPELGGLTDHRFHYPPQSLLDTAVRHQWQGTPPAHYDLDPLRAPYVVVGPFGAWTGVYNAEQLQQQYHVIHRDGPYVLYRRQP